MLEDWSPPTQAGSTLVVLAAEESNAALSFRNLKRVAVLTHESVGVADLLGAASLADLPAGAGRAHCARRRIGHRRHRGGEGLMEHSQVILRPVVSEKSYVLSAANRYTFRVHPDAHKTQIRQAVEALFEVHVVEVRTLSVKSKPKRRARDGRSHALLEEGDRADRAPARAFRSSKACRPWTKRQRESSIDHHGHP